MAEGEALLVHGVVAGDAEPKLDEDRVDLVRHGSLGAVVRRVPADLREGTRRDALAHSDTLQAVQQHADVLPMRYGVVLDDADAVRTDLLDRHRDRLEAMLDRYRGRREMTVRATYIESAVLAELVRGDSELRRL